MARAIQILGLGTALVAGSVWVLACGDGGTGPGTTEQATVVARVLVDGSGESGVTVRLFEGSSTSAISTRTTGSDGRASFSGLDAGSYEAEIDVPTGTSLGSGEAARKAIAAVAGASREVAFALVSSGGGGGEVVEILASGTSFTPSTVTIEPGTTVRWTNGDGQLHTVTPDDHTEWSEASLGSSGETFEHTFNTTGDFPYYCVPHRSAGMTGTITVQ
jgi:plastocyanin